jgi:riboflavin synthase
VFTGIVEEIGTVTAVEEIGDGRVFRIAARVVLDGLKLGDSIAVDGVCQTVTEIDDDAFAVQSVATTLERTTFDEIGSGRRVNLERAVAVGSRLGGHMVQGHVDATGAVLDIQKRGEHTLIDVAMPDEVAAVTVLHGSITINGVSLTVNDLPRAGVVQVSIIPFTREHTNLADLRVGEAVNLEADLIGKYVRRLLEAPLGSGTPDLRRAWGYQ